MNAHSSQHSSSVRLQTIGFAVTGENRGLSYVWVEAVSVEAGRARLAPLFPGCRLAPLAHDDAPAQPFL